MSPNELEELMSDSADNAVKTAQAEFNTPLDFTAQSIATVDDLLLAFIEKYQEKALEEKAVFTICNIFGAYVGETVRRYVKGTWIYDESNPQAPYMLLAVESNTYAFAGICYERLVNDKSVSVKSYFDQALANHQ